MLAALACEGALVSDLIDSMAELSRVRLSPAQVGATLRTLGWPTVRKRVGGGQVRVLGPQAPY